MISYWEVSGNFFCDQIFIFIDFKFLKQCFQIFIISAQKLHFLTTVGGGGSHHGGSIRDSHPAAPGSNLCIDTTDLPTIETTNIFTT